MTDIAEQVARAIHAKRNNPDDNQHWFHEDANKCELSRQLARAAIAALPGEPVAWQYRWWQSGDRWSDWVNLTKESFATLGDIMDVKYEGRQLYAAPAMPGWQLIKTAPVQSKRAAHRAAKGETATDNLSPASPPTAQPVTASEPFRAASALSLGPRE